MSRLPDNAPSAIFPRKPTHCGAYRSIFRSKPDATASNSHCDSSSARAVGRETTVVRPQPYCRSVRSSSGRICSGVKPARCMARQNRLPLPAKWRPVDAARTPGFIPQNATDKPGPRMSGRHGSESESVMDGAGLFIKWIRSAERERWAASTRRRKGLKPRSRVSPSGRGPRWQSGAPHHGAQATRGSISGQR